MLSPRSTTEATPGSVAGVFGILRHPRWLGFLGLALIAALACVGLGLWQLDRLDQRQQRNAVVEAASTGVPAAVDTLVGHTQTVPESLEWRLVRAEGRYDDTNEILLRGQLQDGRPGYHVLTPLVTDAGRALLVDRGWIPVSDQGATTAPAVPAAPAGQVDVVGRIRLSEQVRTARPVQLGERMAVAAVDVQQLSETAAVPLYPVYVELTEQSPPPGAAPELIDAPPVEAGPHLAYAVQWFLFAALVPVGLWVYLRAEIRRPSKAS